MFKEQSAHIADIIYRWYNTLKCKGFSFMMRIGKRTDTRKIAITGMLLAVMLVFNFTSIGFIQIGVVAFTTMHIPVLVGLISEGLLTGVILGFVFGLLSFIKSYTTPTVLYFIFQNPLISIPPRILIPVAAWAVMLLVGKLARKGTHTKHISRVIGAVVGSLTNTVLILGLMAMFFAPRMAEALAYSRAEVTTFIYTLGLTNGLPEAILAGIAVPALCAALDRLPQTGKPE